MNVSRLPFRLLAQILLSGMMAAWLCTAAIAADPLPSWNNGPAKKAIVNFVATVTNEDGENYVPPAERIATFDNDGTLWVEQPLNAQTAFIIDRVKELAPLHPEWKTKEPFKTLLTGDTQAVKALSKRDILEAVMTADTGMTASQFAGLVTEWMNRAIHPRFERLYTELAYQPQLELLSYLRDNGFKTYIISGSGMEFMRPWTERVYGIPPEQVVGSSVKTEFRIKDGEPVLYRLPQLEFIDDKAGKPVGIYEHIGRRPLLAFGNSDNDKEMIEYTTAGQGPRLGLFLHHTDGEREYAYDRKSPTGRLDEVLGEADRRGWIVVDMKRDWSRVFPPVEQTGTVE